MLTFNGCFILNLIITIIIQVIWGSGRGDAYIHAKKFTIFFLSKENTVSFYYDKALLISVLSVSVTSAFPVSLRIQEVS